PGRRSSSRWVRISSANGASEAIVAEVRWAHGRERRVVLLRRASTGGEEVRLSHDRPPGALCDARRGRTGAGEGGEAEHRMGRGSRLGGRVLRAYPESVTGKT